MQLAVRSYFNSIDKAILFGRLAARLAVGKSVLLVGRSAATDGRLMQRVPLRRWTPAR
jgi:hypothetical protein